MSKHTPGPWHSVIENPKLVYDEHCNLICCTHSGHFSDEQHIINAQFIAAAPKIFDLLERLDKWADSSLSSISQEAWMKERDKLFEQVKAIVKENIKS